MNDDIYLIYKIYGLPEIKKEGLTEIEYNHRCKYLRLYIKLIEKCKSFSEEELSVIYYEVHHIFPRTLGGTNNRENLVKMPIRYHLMAHLVILEVYPESEGLLVAANLMFKIRINSTRKNLVERSSAVTRYFSTRTISKIRENFLAKVKSEEYRKKMSKALSGKNSPNYGRHWTLEQKEKASRSRKGRKLSDDHKQKLSRIRKGVPKSEDHKKKISESHKGKKHSEDTRRKMSEIAKDRVKKDPETFKKRAIENFSKLNVNDPEYRKKRSEIASRLAKDPEYLRKQSEAKIKKFSDPVYREYFKSRLKHGGDKINAKKVISPDGVIYGCIKEAADAANVSKTTMSNWVNGVVKKDHGWSFYEETK